MGRLRKHGSIEPCFDGFEQVSRYWDPKHKYVIAKILPGEFYVSKQKELISTTLGSCIAACIWDPLINIGGMNHFLLPVKAGEDVSMDSNKIISEATRYGNFAMESLINALLTKGASRQRLRAKVFGAGNVMKQRLTVGEKNIAFILDYLGQENIELVSQDLGGRTARKVLFDPLSGRAWVRSFVNMHNDTLLKREQNYQRIIKIDNDVELF